jgi:8-oxo-dGTP pyrophosphatase MutT (NUDIX family)
MPSPPRDDPDPPPSAPSWARDAEGDATLEENWLFRLRRERWRSRRTGLSHDYYVFRLADAVNVVALTADDRVVLVRQFRAGAGRDFLETPGGLLNPGEDPLAAGARELLEETGYAGDPPVLLGTVWSNPSLLSSRTATVLITGARPVAEPRLDPGEELSVELVPSRSLPGLLRSGAIDHALVVQGLLWWLLFSGPRV